MPASTVHLSIHSPFIHSPTYSFYVSIHGSPQYYFLHSFITIHLPIHSFIRTFPPYVLPPIYPFTNSSIYLPIHTSVPLCHPSFISVPILHLSTHPPFLHAFTHLCMHPPTSPLCISTYTSTHSGLHPCIYSSIHLSMYPSCVTHLSSHSSVPPSVNASTPAPFHFSVYAFIHMPIHPYISTSIHLPTHLPLSSANDAPGFAIYQKRAGYCCCRDKLTLIWLHRNRCLNRHLNYTINNRDLDTVFWEHHGGGRDRGDGSLLSFTQKAHA